MPAPSNGVALVRIEDSGRGIQAQAQEKLFDGFFSSKVSGNGIGLALCKNIIGRHRGDIWAQNLEPCGAVFSFSLPLATSLNKQQTRQPASPLHAIGFTRRACRSCRSLRSFACPHDWHRYTNTWQAGQFPRLPGKALIKR